MKDGTKLGNDEMVGTIEADGSPEVDGIADGCTDGVVVGGSLPSGDIVCGAKLGISTGRLDGALLVGTTLGSTPSAFVGAVDGMITCIGEAVGAADKVGVAAGDDVIGAVVAMGANVTKSSAKHIV